MEDYLSDWFVNICHFNWCGMYVEDLQSLTFSFLYLENYQYRLMVQTALNF